MEVGEGVGLVVMVGEGGVGGIVWVVGEIERGEGEEGE